MRYNAISLRRGLLSMIVAAAALIGAGTAATAKGEDNWPAWRGPLANGIAPTAKPPLTWSETSNVKWKVRIPGRGSASPIVWENRVFVQTAVPTGASAPAGGGGRGMTAPPPAEPVRFTIQCIDRQSGKLLWEKVAREEVPHEGHHPADGTFASGSALTDGRNVFAFFGSRGIYCYDMEGNLKWSQDLGDMKIKLGFGEGTSPALHGDMLLINWDHEGESFITALNKNTGQTIWKTPREETTSWSTPLVVEHQGKQQVIVSATAKIRSYDLATGKLIWECAGMTRNAIPTPVTANGIVYCTSGYSGNSLLAIRLGASGDLTSTDSIVWRYGKNTPYVPSPLLVGERLFLFASNSPVLSSFDAATGRVVIDARKIEGLNSVYASPIGADGKIYVVGRDGTTVVVKQSDTLEVLATNKLDDKIDASPAVVGRELFLRGLEHLYCIAEK